MMPLKLFWYGCRKKTCVISSAAERGPGVILNMWYDREACLLVYRSLLAVGSTDVHLKIIFSGIM